MSWFLWYLAGALVFLIVSLLVLFFYTPGSTQNDKIILIPAVFIGAVIWPFAILILLYTSFVRNQL